MGGTIANKHPEFKFNAEICQFLEQFGLAKHSVSVAIVSQYGPGDHCTGGSTPLPNYGVQTPKTSLQSRRGGSNPQLSSSNPQPLGTISRAC